MINLLLAELPDGRLQIPVSEQKSVGSQTKLRAEHIEMWLQAN